MKRFNKISASKSAKTRFFDQVEYEAMSGCWLWSGRIVAGNRMPYGRFRLNGRDQNTHRISFKHFKGSIPKDKFVLHHCDTPQCVNPDHLYLGDQFANMQDCARRGRTFGQKQRRLATSTTLDNL